MVAWADPELLNDPCFSEVGVLPPKSKADYAYVLRGLQHLSEDGTMAVMLPTGALFRSAAEGEIRENDYNLNIPRYIDTFSEKKIDVEATMSSLSAKQKEMIELLNKLDTPEARQAIKAVSISE